MRLYFKYPNVSLGVSQNRPRLESHSLPPFEPFRFRHSWAVNISHNTANYLPRDAMIIKWVIEEEWIMAT